MNLKKIPVWVYVLLVVSIIFVVASVIVPLYLNNKIRADLQTQVTDQCQGEYKLHIDKVRINIFNQSISIYGFKLNPVKNIHPKAVKYSISATRMNLVDFKVWAFVINKDLILDKIEMLNPSIRIFRNTTYQKNTNDHSIKHFSLYTIIHKYIHSLSVCSINIHNADINIYDNLNDLRPKIITKNNSLNISNFMINKNAEQQKRFFLADTFQLIINRFSYKTEQNLSTLFIKKITASYMDSTLLLDSLQLIPNYSKREFAKKAGHQTDRISISVLLAAFSQTDIKSFFERNRLEAEQLKVSDFNISIYRDKNDPPVTKRAKSVQQLLKKIPILTNIELIRLLNAEITYEEVSKGATSPGSISFNHLNGRITGFTTNPAIYSKTRMTLNANCLFMNTGKLQAHYSFPLNTEETVFDCSARLNSMPLTAINKILVPNAHIIIKEGMVDSVILSFHADDKGSLGTLLLGYHDLKLGLLNQNNEKKFGKGVISLLARIFIIKKENPQKNRNIRIAKINYKRDPNHFIFGYTWQSILSGIKPTIGLPRKAKKKTMLP